MRYTTLQYTALQYPTLHYTTLITPHHSCNCSHTTLITLHHSYNSTTLQLQLHHTTSSSCGEVTTATIANTPENTTPTTFRSISGFALPSVIHNNEPLLQVSYFWNFRHRFVRHYWYKWWDNINGLTPWCRRPPFRGCVYVCICVSPTRSPVTGVLTINGSWWHWVDHIVAIPQKI